MEKFQFSIMVKSIPTIEKINNVKINVFALDVEEVCLLYALRKSSQYCAETIIAFIDFADKIY